jgi:hypothetical protein
LNLELKEMAMKKLTAFLAFCLFTFSFCLASYAGQWTANGYLYKPSLGASGQTEHNLFNQGFDQTDARLAALGPGAQISPTAPLTYNATTGVVALPQASATVNGYLASGDWSAFHAKEPAISLGSSLQYWRGDKTWQTLNPAAVGAAPATSGTSILKGNGAGGTTAAVSNTDYAAVRDNGDPTYLWNGNYLLSRISDIWASITGGNLIVWGSNVYGTNLATVISTIGNSTPANLIVPPGTFAISANVAVTPNIRLLPHNGAKISIPTGVTLTINGPFEAGLYQVFSCAGTGQVIFAEGAIKESNVAWWGASTAATDNTSAIQAAVNSFGIIAFPEGAFNVASQITIAHAGCFLRGAPANLSTKSTARTTINYTSASGILFQFSTPGTMLSYVGMDGFNLTSSSGNSTAIQICDVSRPQFKNISIYPWYGTGIDFRGRELGYFENLDIQCNVPIIINKNSNASNGTLFPGGVGTSIDIDFTTFRNVNLVCNSTASTGASVTIADGVNLTNVHFDTVDFELGANGVYWNDTTSTITSANLTFDNCRMEQANPTTGWCFWINRASVLDNVDIHQFTDSSANGGFAYIRNCRDFKVSNSTYYGTAAVPINGLGCSSVTLENFLIPSTAANSFPDMACVLFIKGAPATPINYASYISPNSAGNLHFQMFGTNVFTYNGNLAGSTALTISSIYQPTSGIITVSAVNAASNIFEGGIGVIGYSGGTYTIMPISNTANVSWTNAGSTIRIWGNSQNIMITNDLASNTAVNLVVDIKWSGP